MNDVLFFAALFGGWITLNLWVLPLFGIQTCMSGACRVPHNKHAAQHATRSATNHEHETVHPGDH